MRPCPMNIAVLTTPRGGYVVWAHDPALPASLSARLAHFDDLDTACLMLYCFTSAPGTRELLAADPEVLASLTEHCGTQRH